MQREGRVCLYNNATHICASYPSSKEREGIELQVAMLTDSETAKVSSEAEEEETY